MAPSEQPPPKPSLRQLRNRAKTCFNRADAVGTAALHRTSGQCSDGLIRYLIVHE